MIVGEQVPLARLSTLRVGGPARFVCEITSEEEVRTALGIARTQGLPWRVLGEGSNILAIDAGFDGVLMQMKSTGIEQVHEGNGALVRVAAGESWDGFVRYAAKEGLWGIENLAGIPGTVGASPVQNIGAYGTEVKDSIVSVSVLNTETGAIEEIPNADCNFGYRESRFKREPELIILSVTFLLQKEASPQLNYADLLRAKEQGASMETPATIGDAVREIRSRKFPNLSIYGTAGSFFKNPVIAPDTFTALRDRYEALPGYETANGVKIPLAFVLDKILALRGYCEGNVELFSNQPLVLVAHAGATQEEIDRFADSIAQKVFDATGIKVEREVRMFP
ncbi:MAG TPA: UDP-N-acetylmuramate dehydrogenase [Candidatus Paceibacterota bacterium]|nr:UDP-N-acetylmuramate dehydrogenase [Candidatus Paceibacterota bacterium]